jgi:hypothetical protein
MNEQEHREDIMRHYAVDPEFGTGECFRRYAELFPQYISDFFALAIMPDLEDTGEDLSAEDLAAVDRAWLKFKASTITTEKAKNSEDRTNGETNTRQ